MWKVWLKRCVWQRNLVGLRTIEQEKKEADEIGSFNVIFDQKNKISDCY